MKLFAILILILVVSGCVSRTVTAPSTEHGKGNVVVEKKTVWFWDKDF